MKTRSLSSALTALLALTVQACGELGVAAPTAEGDEVPSNFLESGLTGGSFRIQAEDYDRTGSGAGFFDTTPGNTGLAYRTDDVDVQACGDVGGGFNVGWIRDTEWTAYTFTAPAAGDYTFTARLASALSTTKQLQASVDGRALPVVSTSVAAGWQVYSNVALGTLTLDKGSHTLKVLAVVGGYNLNHFDVSYTPVCTVTSKLVNTCRPWLGAWAEGSLDAAADTASQIAKHEQRIGRQVDIVHTYHPPGSKPLSSYEREVIARANTILLTNWKPAAKWADADGRSASVNAFIDSTADALKSVAPKKVMLAISHEPEDDVSGGVTCTKVSGSAGTPADYRAMWKNVRARFDAKGVTNVVYVWNTMGYKGWFCMMKDLYPGDALVDWIMWDPYIRGANDSFNQSIGSFYSWLEANSDATHNFKSKPYGLAEWGTWDSTQPDAYRAFDDAKKAVEANTFPNLKALVIFDARSGSRIAYSLAGDFDATEVQHYRAYAQSAAFKDP
ncbi:MAG: carbohydrate-binding protein [Myxococcaceae bacterium]|nr:carbohydrate-binding protein [Myxococcaceae bacterium]